MMSRVFKGSGSVVAVRYSSRPRVSGKDLAAITGSIAEAKWGVQRVEKPRVDQGPYVVVHCGFVVKLTKKGKRNILF